MGATMTILSIILRLKVKCQEGVQKSAEFGLPAVALKPAASVAGVGKSSLALHSLGAP